jgi:hypothetical protein
VARSTPDMSWRIVAGLCVPEKRIVLAQWETCWPGMGAGVVVSADAAPADSRRVPAARVVVTSMRTGYMIDAFRGGECASSIRRTDGWFLFPPGSCGVFHFGALKYRFQRGTMEKR